MAIPMGRQLCFALLIVTLPLALGRSATAAGQETKKPLYERLGGVYPIATVVDDFIERLLVNDVLNANPRISAARAAVPKAGLKYRVTELVCQATGGPCHYTGRDMKTAHQHLNITEAEWRAMAADFKRSLDHFKVPAAEQNELFTIVESVKPQIVVDRSTPR
jgi:hemoglobin